MKKKTTKVFTGGKVTTDAQTSLKLPKPLTMIGKAETAKAKTTGGTGKASEKKKPIKIPVISKPTGTVNKDKMKKAPKNLVKTTPSKVKKALTKKMDK